MTRYGQLGVIITLSLAVAAGVLWAAADGSATTASWRTLASSGRVEARPPSVSDPMWRPLQRGADVAALSHVRTFSRARTTLTRQGDLILLAADSEVVLPEQASDGSTIVVQKSGHAVYKVAPRHAGGRFEVQTPFLVAGVKGTRFSVILEEDRAAVSVLEGVVEVRSPLTGEAEDLTAGMVAIVEGRDGRMEIHDEADRADPRRSDRDGKEGRGRKEKDNEAAEPAVDSGHGSAPGGMEEKLQDSKKLASDLVEADDSLVDLDLNNDADLWGDLGGDTQVLTRSTGAILDETTTRLDPVASDPTTDPSVIDKLLNLIRK